MNLHDRARKLAEELADVRGDGVLVVPPERIAAAMAALAREFAAEALRQPIGTGEFRIYLDDEAIAAAISRAEEGEGR